MIQQDVVFEKDVQTAAARNSETNGAQEDAIVSQESGFAQGFIETQGFTAVFVAIDTACKAADVEIVGKEKLGGGFVTVVVKAMQPPSKRPSRRESRGRVARQVDCCPCNPPRNPCSVGRPSSI